MERDDESWPHDVLEQWTIRAMPADLEERVMSQMQEQWNMGASGREYAAQPTRNGSTATVTAIAAMAAAAAALVIAIGRNAAAPSPPSTTGYVAVAADPPRAPTGHLTLEVTPPDANVEVDGVPQTGPSPFVTTGLAPGPHTVRVHRDGFAEWTRTIDVPDTQLHLPITLAPVHGTGILVPPKAPTMVDVPPAGSKRALAPEVKGGLGQDEVRKVVRSHIGDVKACFDEGLRRNPKLGGRVVVQFTIGPDGKVPVSVVQDTTLGDHDVARCIGEAAREWTFPEPDGGGNVVVSYPFQLTAD